MSTKEQTVDRGILRGAVGRTITCPDCGHALDVKTAVLIILAKGAAHALAGLLLGRISCGSCWDSGFDSRYTVAETVAELVSAGLDVIDGRTL